SLTKLNGRLFFTATDGTHGTELWKSDGTAAGTTQVKDINNSGIGSSLRNPVDVNGSLFFSAHDGVHGVELWKSDATRAGAHLVKAIFPGGYTGYFGGIWLNSSSPTNLTNVNGTLFFTANDSNGTELWKSDGTQAGTVLVKDIMAGSRGAY